MVNGVKKEEVRLFEQDAKGNTKIYIPLEDTFGMGVDGILQSEYYGLDNSYDKLTAQKYQKRAELFSKLIKGELDEAGQEELYCLVEQLGGMPSMYNTIDFLYDDFMCEYRKSRYYNQEKYTIEDIRARREFIKKLIEALFEKQGTE